MYTELFLRIKVTCHVHMLLLTTPSLPQLSLNLWANQGHHQTPRIHIQEENGREQKLLMKRSWRKGIDVGMSPTRQRQ